MADDIADAENEIRAHEGIDNHPFGRVIGRIFRTVKQLAARQKALEDRVQALEGRLGR